MKTEKLYKLTNGIGIYWVIASDPTEAEDKLIKLLDDNDYGFRGNRKVKSIDIIAESVNNSEIGYIGGKFLIP